MQEKNMSHIVLDQLMLSNTNKGQEKKRIGLSYQNQTASISTSHAILVGGLKNPPKQIRVFLILQKKNLEFFLLKTLAPIRKPILQTPPIYRSYGIVRGWTKDLCI